MTSTTSHSRNRALSQSKLVAVVSDIHFDLHDQPTWTAFRRWHTDVKPWMTVILGDFVDLGMMSSYVQEPGAKLQAIPQIKCFVQEVNALRPECTRLVVSEGNHDERWAKFVGGINPQVLEGALGMSLKEQCQLQGMADGVEWLKEAADERPFKVGQYWLRHGHNQAGRFGGGRHLAANRITKNLGESEIIGHHHRAQLFAQTAFGRTAVAIANPHMAGPQSYAKDPDWQKGFTIMELHAPDYERATAYPVVVDEGVFSWGGLTYDGNEPEKKNCPSCRKRRPLEDFEDPKICKRCSQRGK